MAEVRAFVQNAAKRAGFVQPTLGSIVLAIDEAVTNVIRHGYDGREGQPIDLTIRSITQNGRVGLQFTIRDMGKHVDPDQMVGRDLKELRAGGLGVHILKTVMDEIEYKRREPVGMELRLIKMVDTVEDSAVFQEKESADGE